MMLHGWMEVSGSENAGSGTGAHPTDIASYPESGGDPTYRIFSLTLRFSGVGHG
uniref:Uncharacterized protein n=1 Tax=Candidatus Kentrum sp. FW TaxID=2126338 RepID=A0A450TWD4_9GAMM|nr:MAG: hypothetical protein BECKFW1821C_GA0114237_104825 [Candidatus Kentron sp. FW]